jgi:hypothetical protein
MAADLEKNEGFLRTDVTPIRRALWDRETFLADVSNRNRELLALVGVTDTSVLMTPMQPAIDELMAEVARLAPRWTFPASPRDAAVEGMGRQQILKEYPKAAIRGAAMQDATFSIRKNRLGVPLERSKDGFVLYKMPEEKFCRQQAFQYTEPFTGAGYQKPSGVKLNYVRYLNCR